MPEQNVIVRTYSDRDEEDVVALWARENPNPTAWNDPRDSIHRKMAVDPELFLVAQRGEKVVGTAMAGYDGHRGWIYSVAVAPECRREGIARRLLVECERRLRDRGCPKINLQVLPGNDAAVALYRSLGFRIEERINMGKPIV